jgi:hypothetical protein
VVVRGTGVVGGTGAAAIGTCTSGTGISGTGTPAGESRGTATPGCAPALSGSWCHDKRTRAAPSSSGAFPAPGRTVLATRHCFCALPIVVFLFFCGTGTPAGGSFLAVPFPRPFALF